MTRRALMAVLALAALVNVGPLILLPLGGDSYFHFVMIDCFAGQLWQGDPYPRWCMQANAGLGAPFFLFYFPLPYYITALFYPLTQLGLSLYGLYIIGAYLAGFISALTCYYWLRDSVSPGRALLGAILYLYMPYRMEVVFFRAAYAEMWCMAWLPLLFLYTRRLARGEKAAVAPLAGSVALALLTHLPCAMVAAWSSALYVLIVARSRWRATAGYAAAWLWGAAMAAFYVLPAIYYRDAITPDSKAKNAATWVNSYLSFDNVMGQGRPLLLMVPTVLALALLIVGLLRRRRGCADGFVRREIVAWSAMIVMAFLLLLPLSAPFYAHLGPLSELLFPWRMQTVFVLGMTALLAAWLQWAARPERRKTWKMDLGLGLAFLVLISLFMTSVRDDSFIPTGERIIAAHQIGATEYRSRWTDEAHFSMPYILERQQRKDTILQAEIEEGEGALSIEGWSWRGIRLQVEAVKPVSLRLDHTYFPLWRATADDGASVTLYPQARTGQILLDVPAGVHRIMLRPVIAADGWMMLVSIASSVAGMLWCLQIFCKRRLYFDNGKAAC